MDLSSCSFALPRDSYSDAFYKTTPSMTLKQLFRNTVAIVNPKPDVVKTVRIPVVLMAELDGSSSYQPSLALTSALYHGDIGARFDYHPALYTEVVVTTTRKGELVVRIDPSDAANVIAPLLNTTAD